MIKHFTVYALECDTCKKWIREYDEFDFTQLKDIETALKINNWVEVDGKFICEHCLKLLENT